MADYIKREDALCNAYTVITKCRRNIKVVSVEQLTELTAADVRPVVRGRWVNGKCDNCGEHAPYWCFATTFHESNYCPNCGADMREVDNESH